MRQRNERGGAVVTLAFVLVGITLLSMLTSTLLSLHVTNTKLEVAKQSESAVRVTVDTIIGDLNSRGYPSVLADLNDEIVAGGGADVRDEFGNSAINQGEVALTSAEFVDGNIVLGLEVRSNGVLQFTERNVVTLYVAGVLRPELGGAANWAYDAELAPGEYRALWSAVKPG